jgi:hypothetical protein
MNRTRAQIRANQQPEVDRLLGITSLANATELIAVFISRYGNHLAQSWACQDVEYSAELVQQPVAAVNISAFNPSDPIDF